MAGIPRRAARASWFGAEQDEGVQRSQAVTRVTAIALALLLIALSAASALADGSEPEISPDNLAFYLGELTNPEAAEELPHVDLDRDEALDLVTAVFTPALQNPAGIYDELDVEKFHADNVAVIAAGEQPSAGGESESSQEPTLLTSTSPLATRNAEGELEAVDLSLEHVEGELQPANPLVDLGIPGQLDQGISLPDTDVEINVVGAPDRAPSIAEQSTAFYPNVAQDTDFIVAPTPDGVETLTQLRSSEAPRSQTFNLSLPAGAELIEAEAGGAKVIHDDKAIVVIPPPTAYDAEGTSVPVSLEVSGKSLTITASPAEDAKYPVLVDPLYEQPYVWLWNNSTAGMYDWTSSINDVAKPTPWAFDFREEGYISGVGFFKGLSIQTSVGTVPTISRGRWTYYVPRYHTDYNLPLHVRPTSYIKKMMLKRLWFKVDDGLIKPITSSPGLKFGIWNEPLGKWTSEGVWWGTQGNLTNLDWEYISKNDDNQVGAKFAKVELEVHEPQLQYRNLLVGEAAIELSDSDAPALAGQGNPAKWVNDKSDSPFSFTFTDPGLGVKEIVVKHPNGAQMATKSPCTGIASNPCPRSWNATGSGWSAVPYAPGLLPQGENFVKVEAVDPIGRRSPEEGHGDYEARIKVDHTNPKLALSGSLVDHATKGTKAAQYTLKYDATDGDHAAASALAPFGSAGTGEGKFQRPQGIAIDSGGNLWVVDRENNRVMKFDETGKLLLQFGGLGSADGKFNDPRGIAISSFGSGTVWISDLGNKRVQAFNMNGEFLRKITKDLVLPYGLATGPVGVVWVSDPGTGKVSKYAINGAFIESVYGSAANPNGGSDLNYPIGLATGANGDIWVVDSGNNRLKKYGGNGQFITQFGTTGTGAGQLKNPLYVTIASSGNLLVTEELTNRVQVFHPNGVFQRQFGSAGTGNAQLSEGRGIAINAQNTAFVVDTGNRRVVKWSHADFDPQSGVVSTQIEVDGQPVEKYEPGCATKSCPVSREWLLDANDYPSGTHKVKVTATDGVGLSATPKELTFTTDATAPQLNAPSQFFTAPEGWLEQKSYSYSATASDSAGYGVTSLVLAIDGKVVKSTTQACPNGGCAALVSGTINMATYKGGAHPAELIATDAAGNVAKKAWTINVDPKGQAPVSEVVDTLEALESTSPVNALGESQVEGFEGSAPGLGVDEIGGQLTATGTQVPMEVDTEPANGATVEVLEEGSFALPCSDPPAENTEEPSESSEEGEGVEIEPCATSEELEAKESEVEENEDWETFGLTPLQIEPTNTAATATDAVIVDGNATVSANTSDHVDTIIRPLSDGGMTFENIRDSSGPEVFSWSVDLEPDQELKAIDDQTVQVYYEGGHLAFVIRAIAAHDAVGTTVSTKLSISGDHVVTLKVDHRKQPFVYPVIAGTGWQGGYRLHLVEMPPPEPFPELEGEFEEFEGNVHVVVIDIGPAVADTSNVPLGASSPAVPRKARAYNFNECGWARKGEVGLPPPRKRAQITQQCHGQLNGSYISWAMSMSGVFHYKYGYWVWTNEAPVCRTWGPSAPQEVHCFATKPNPSNDGLDIVGDFRFKPHVLAPSILAYCERLNGRIPIRPGDPIPGEPVFHGYRVHNPRYPVHQADSCPWGQFPNSVGR